MFEVENRNLRILETGTVLDKTTGIAHSRSKNGFEFYIFKNKMCVGHIFIKMLKDLG